MNPALRKLIYVLSDMVFWAIFLIALSIGIQTGVTHGRWSGISAYIGAWGFGLLCWAVIRFLKGL